MFSFSVPSTAKPIDLEEDQVVDLTNEMEWLVLGEQPELTIIGQSESVKPGQAPQPFTALVHLKIPSDEGAADAAAVRAPVDLVTVLDVSGSMNGPKLELVKTAMEFVIRNLRPQDRLSIISFSDVPYVHLGLKRMTDEGRAAALHAVQKLRTLGGTEIRPGLHKGFEILSSRKNRNPVSSIMLLTDGLDNAIYTGRCKVLPVESYLSSATEVVPVHTFGFGSDHDPNAMVSIAEATGGSFCYVDQESRVKQAFAHCIGGLLSVVANEVEVLIEAAGGATVTSVEATSGTTSTSQGTWRVKLGSLYAEEKRDILVEIMLPSSSPGFSSLEALRAGGSFLDPASGKVQQLPRPGLTLKELVNDGDSEVNIQVDSQKNRVIASKAMAAARQVRESWTSSGQASGKEELEEAKAKIESSRAFGAGDRLSVSLVSELKDLIDGMSYISASDTSARLFAAGTGHMNQRQGLKPLAPYVGSTNLTCAQTSLTLSCGGGQVPYAAHAYARPFAPRMRFASRTGAPSAYAPTSAGFGGTGGYVQEPATSSFGVSDASDNDEGSYTTRAMAEMVDKANKFKSELP